jgi:hypothetical protein
MSKILYRLRKGEEKTTQYVVRQSKTGLFLLCMKNILFDRFINK